MDWIQYEKALKKERALRRNLRSRGTPYHYWQARGDAEPPPRSHWCNKCVGYFGVPHDTAHPDGGCTSLTKALHGNRVCACIECVVAERLAGKTT